MAISPVIARWQSVTGFPNDPALTTRTVSIKNVPDLGTVISPINWVGPEANPTPLQNDRRSHTSPVLPRLHNSFRSLQSWAEDGAS
jgi:hypothetical protein